MIREIRFFVAFVSHIPRVTLKNSVAKKVIRNDSLPPKSPSPLGEGIGVRLRR
jgi:hypothetical protein